MGVEESNWIRLHVVILTINDARYVCISIFRYQEWKWWVIFEILYLSVQLNVSILVDSIQVQLVSQLQYLTGHWNWTVLHLKQVPRSITQTVAFILTNSQCLLRMLCSDNGHWLQNISRYF